LDEEMKEREKKKEKRLFNELNEEKKSIFKFFRKTVKRKRNFSKRKK
jgi:hypothetical protein